MIIVLYRPVSEHARAVEDFKRELDRDKIEIQLVDVDTKEGVVLAELHDILQFPSVIATKSDGSVVQSWIGTLPLVKEVGYFAHQ